MGRKPVAVVASRVIAAPRSALWNRTVYFGEWTLWHPDISWVSPAAQCVPGASFEWTWRAHRARSLVMTVSRHEHVAWATESAIGTTAHQWWFVPDGDSCVVTTSCHLDVLTRRHVRMMHATVERGLERWLDALARDRERAHAVASLGTAERGARTAVARPATRRSLAEASWFGDLADRERDT